MIAKQLSIFIENRKGRLTDVLSVLKKNDINMLSLSLADTSEFGLLRLIVDKPDLGKDMLTSNGFSSKLTDVLIVKLNHSSGSLQVLVDILSNKDINIEYMYGLSTDKDKAFIVLKTSDLAKADEILLANGVKTISTEEIIG